MTLLALKPIHPPMKSAELGYGLSLWLDIVRLGAALTVVLYHSAAPQFGGSWLHVGTIGLDAVVVFFVLSGFVIAHVATTKEIRFDLYAASRLGRLWSVLLPALVLTEIADKVGMAIAPSVYQGWTIWLSPSGSLLNLFIAAIFCNELWLQSIPPLTNGPVWSLGFEAWYYAIFGTFHYLQGRLKWLITAAFCCVAGPKILLLFPIWIFGAAAFRLSQFKLRTSVGTTLFALPLVALIVLKYFGLRNFLGEIEQRMLGDYWDVLKYAKFFLWYYVFGLAVALHFIGFSSIQDRLAPYLTPFYKVIRTSAGFTLSIYLFHYPLMMMVAAALNRLDHGVFRTSATVVITLALCVALGTIFENKRKPLRNALLSFFRRGRPRPSSA
jgi:peptidoglycan/LPS O-acetylase OafA/YrhL